jgi:hypothetical protein
MIANIAVSVFTVVVGFKMWFTVDEGMTLFAMLVIFIGVSALEYNVTTVLKSRQTPHKNIVS